MAATTDSNDDQKDTVPAESGMENTMAQDDNENVKVTEQEGNMKDEASNDTKEPASMPSDDFSELSTPEESPTDTLSPLLTFAIQITVHIFCLVLYLIPIFTPNEYGGPTLDELHIMGSDNKDILGTSTLLEVFQNDYWGRPMQSPSSHRSWRPLTVLSFRWLKGIYPSSQLTAHRCINILTHAAAAEVVGILASRIVSPTSKRQALMVRLFTKVVFALHPTHVEVTANAANRNHILAIMLSTSLCDPLCPIWFVFPALICGFLCSETFLFQVPAAMVTVVVVQYFREQRAKPSSSTSLVAVIRDYIFAALRLFPRLFLMVLSIVMYLGGRAYFDTLDIPEGLIRRAENPFYHFEGEHRVRNYLYTLAIHVGKSLGMDPIGFSHEYGFDCVPALEDWNDPRLLLPLGFGAVLLVAIVSALTFPRTMFGPVAIHVAWMLTLFPVSGVVKVGTFISDRIVVPLSMSVSLGVGIGLFRWWTHWRHKVPFGPIQVVLVTSCLVTSYMKVHQRSLDWMDSISLMKSSLENCPRFAKVHMELSKVYSGLYPDLFDLALAREHLNTAREIDPDLCDLHQQFAHVGIQEGNYLEYEEELTQAVLCPFTSGGAFPRWQQYWDVIGKGAAPAELASIQQRKAKYTQIIQNAIAEEQAKEEAKAAAAANTILA
eukprot:Nitzschia sp. Nitz4//scaffold6_size259037//43779//45764//NITZ4_001047-RA/size259037-processed-gene-0.57-mRNA-1//-1//CDS//3329556812//366//frame0